jgi:hypothetical protein
MQVTTWFHQIIIKLGESNTAWARITESITAGLHAIQSVLEGRAIVPTLGLVLAAVVHCRSSCTGRLGVRRGGTRVCAQASVLSGTPGCRGRPTGNGAG